RGQRRAVHALRTVGETADRSFARCRIERTKGDNQENRNMERATENANAPLPSPTRRKLIKAATVLAGLASLGIGNVASGQSAVGQSWPSRPVRVVVPF